MTTCVSINIWQISVHITCNPTIIVLTNNLAQIFWRFTKKGPHAVLEIYEKTVKTIFYLILVAPHRCFLLSAIRNFVNFFAIRSCLMKRMFPPPLELLSVSIDGNWYISITNWCQENFHQALSHLYMSQNKNCRRMPHWNWYLSNFLHVSQILYNLNNLSF